MQSPHAQDPQHPASTPPPPRPHTLSTPAHDATLPSAPPYCTATQDTPYEGGVFRVDITLDDQYPFVPPKMRFLTRVWHPNVSSQSGAICLDVSAALA